MKAFYLNKNQQKFKSLLFLLFCLTLLFISCTYFSNDKSEKIRKHSAANKHKAWQFDKIVGQTIYFKNGKKYETKLYDLKYIGQLQTKHKAPYLILSGRGCDECDAGTSIYIQSPSDGPMKDEAGQTRYEYPGNERDFESNELLLKSHMYFTKGNKPDANYVIWLSKRLLENNSWIDQFFIVTVKNDSLKETMKLGKDIPNDKLPALLKPCIELKGVDYTSEP